MEGDGRLHTTQFPILEKILVTPAATNLFKIETGILCHSLQNINKITLRSFTVRFSTFYKYTSEQF